MPNWGKNDHPGELLFSQNEAIEHKWRRVWGSDFKQTSRQWWIMKAVVKLGLLFIFQLIRAGDISKLIKDCGRFFYFALKGEQA